MNNNMTLLLLDKQQVKDLDQRGFTDITKFNNRPVPTRLMCEILILLSKIYSEKVDLIKFSSEDVGLLQDSDREYYLYLNNKTVGETLIEEVNTYLINLRSQKADLNDDFGY